MTNKNIKEVEGGEVTTVADADGVEIDTGTTSVWIRVLNLAKQIFFRIASLTEDTSPVGTDDYLVTYDNSAAEGKKVLPNNLLKVINSLTEDTSPDGTADYLATYDASALAAKKLLLNNFLKVINSLTADSSPDRANDYVATYDASASAAKKVLLNNLGAYSLQCSAGVAAGHSPADATTYYFGSIPVRDPGTTAAVRRVYIPRTGTITRIDVYMTFTAGSGETSTMSFRLNNTTDTTISSAVDLSSSPFVANVTGLSIAVTAGDYFEIKWVTPTWVTNPTAVAYTVNVFIS